MAVQRGEFLIRPPDIVCRRTSVSSGILSPFPSSSFFFFFFFFAAWSPSSLNRTQQKSATCSQVTAISKRIPKSGVSPPPTNRGPKTTFFGRLRDLTANLTAYVFGTKCDIENRSSALITTRGVLHRPKMSCTLVHKRHQIEPPFITTLRKFCFLRHCQASQTEISKQNSIKLCQTVDSKSR